MNILKKPSIHLTIQVLLNRKILTASNNERHITLDETLAEYTEFNE
jgi:hypothetical protein